jgi:hypothetical protein
MVSIVKNLSTSQIICCSVALVGVVVIPMYFFKNCFKNGFCKSGNNEDKKKIQILFSKNKNLKKRVLEKLKNELTEKNNLGMESDITISSILLDFKNNTEVHIDFDLNNNYPLDQYLNHPLSDNEVYTRNAWRIGIIILHIQFNIAEEEISTIYNSLKENKLKRYKNDDISDEGNLLSESIIFYDHIY